MLSTAVDRLMAEIEYRRSTPESLTDCTSNTDGLHHRIPIADTTITDRLHQTTPLSSCRYTTIGALTVRTYLTNQQRRLLFFDGVV